MTLALYGKSRRRQWMLVALALFALLGAMTAAFAVLVPTRAASVTAQLTPDPELYEGPEKAKWGNPTCSDLDDVFGGGQTWSQVSTGGWYDPNTATFPITLNVDATHWVKITGIVAGNPMTFDWESNFGIDAVMVKQAGGPHNIYVYDPPGPESFGDTGLQPNLNPNGISHAIFCYDGFTTPTPGDPSIAIEKTNDTGDNIVNPGETFNWIIKVTVSGAATTTNTSITDGLPGDFSGTGAPEEDSTYIDCSASSGDTTDCTLASGAPVGDYFVTIPVKAFDNPEACGFPGTNTAYAQMGTEERIDDDDTVTINCGQTIVTTVRVCKVFEDNADGVARGDTKFDFEIDYVDDSQTSQTAQTSITLAEGEGPECKEVDLLGDVDAATFSELATPITDESGYPMYAVMDDDPATGDSVVVIIWSGEGCSDESQLDFLREAQTQELEYDGTCQVTFYNKEVPGEVSPTGDLRVEKYLDINGDGDANDVALGEGPIAAWNMTVSGPDVNGVFPTGAGGSVSFSGLNTGDGYAVTEALPAGWVLTNVKVDGANSAVNVTKNVTIPDGTTRVVAYYNQPLGSLNVHKDAVTSHNGGPNVPAPNDDDGWTVTVVSAACGINQSKQTDASGNASFTGLPLCTDYVVSENTVNAGSPGFAPFSATSVASVTPNGQTVTFTNRLATFDPPCQNCIQVIPTPTPTTVPPTATPTNTVVPPPATPTPEEATEGERTPGPTPIAPSTGTGSGGGSASMNILLLVGGLAVLSGGLSLTVAGKRRRS